MTRRAMTSARKRRIHQRENGVCYHCGEPVEMFGPGVRYDHRVGVWIAQADEDADVFPAHTACDKPKTAADQAVIAHIKRLIRKADRNLRRAGKRAIQNRPFQKAFSRSLRHPRLKRTVSGRVVER